MLAISREEAEELACVPSALSEPRGSIYFCDKRCSEKAVRHTGSLRLCWLSDPEERIDRSTSESWHFYCRSKSRGFSGQLFYGCMCLSRCTSPALASLCTQRSETRDFQIKLIPKTTRKIVPTKQLSGSAFVVDAAACRTGASKT